MPMKEDSCYKYKTYIISYISQILKMFFRLSFVSKLPVYSDRSTKTVEIQIPILVFKFVAANVGDFFNIIKSYWYRIGYEKL
jgi:hypothetical protein